MSPVYRLLKIVVVGCHLRLAVVGEREITPKKSRPKLERKIQEVLTHTRGTSGDISVGVLSNTFMCFERPLNSFHPCILSEDRPSYV